MKILKSLIKGRVEIPELDLVLVGFASKRISDTDAKSDAVTKLKTQGLVSVMTPSQFHARHAASVTKTPPPARIRKTSEEPTLELEEEFVDMTAEPVSVIKAEESLPPADDAPADDAPADDAPEELLSATAFSLLQKQKQIDYLISLGVTDYDDSTKKTLEEAYDYYLISVE